MKRILWACSLLLIVVPCVQAHPCFTGAYTAGLPCPGTATYVFEEPRFIGAGMWEGCVQTIIDGRLVSRGHYELRMWSPTQGTVSIKEGEMIVTAVGIVDLQQRSVEYLGTVYVKK